MHYVYIVICKKIQVQFKDHTIGQDSETPRLNKASPFVATAQT